MSSTASSNGGAPTETNNSSPSSLPDPFSTGPSVYLYGFLATLVLIFLVSIGVAWRGYHTRRLLRARIDEAIARGVLMPGYDSSNPHLPLFQSGRRGNRGPLPPRPIMYEGWIGSNASEVEKDWDIKPASLTGLKPIIPEPPKEPEQPHAKSPRFSHWLDPLRQYWFVTPPDGADANQLQGRPARGERSPPNGAAATGSDATAATTGQETKDELKDVEEVVTSVLIAMPDKSRSSSRRISMGVASSPRPSSSTAPPLPMGLTALQELPPLMLGVVQMPLVPTEEQREHMDEKIPSASKEKATEVP